MPEKVKDSTVGVPLRNCPLYKAIYRLKSKDHIVGFTKRAIFKGYKRINNSITKSAELPKKTLEKFPENQIKCELQANFVNYNKARTNMYIGHLRKWAKDRGKLKKELVSEKQVVEFAKNMFLSWTVEQQASFSIDHIVKELITLGLPINNRVIEILVKAFKGEDTENDSISVNEFLTFMRGSKIDEHISNVLKRIVEKKEVLNNIRSNIVNSPNKSINYKTDAGFVVKIPLEGKANKQKVILDTRNYKNERILMEFMYDKQGNLINKESTTIEEIEVIQEWWNEIEKEAGCTDEVPITIAINFLISKNVVKNSNQAKQLLGSTVRHSKPLIKFDDFKKFLYRGVFRNVIKDLCTEVKRNTDTNSTAYPEFVKIGSYKRKLLMTAIDPNDPQHQQGAKIIDKLKKQYEKMGEYIKLQITNEESYKSRQVKIKQRQNYSLGEQDHHINKYKEHLKDTKEIIQKYKKVLFTQPKFNEFE